MPNHPNLLLIFTDQQRADTMACYGNDRIQTPNLNALASESFIFEHAYVTQPVCTPSRASILTGLYPHTHGCTGNNIRLDPGVPTIAELVPGEYTTAYCGKWHLGDEVTPQHGFKTWISTEDFYRTSYSKAEYLDRLSDYHHFLVHHGFEPDAELEGARVFSRLMAAELAEPYTKASFQAQQVSELVREVSDQPFVICVNFLEPHPPYSGPFNDLYPPNEMPGSPTFLKTPPGNAALLHRVMAAYYMEGEELGFDLRTEAGWRGVYARYWGNVTLVDRAVGRILQALEESGVADNTIVAYTSEHGDMMGSHGILGKTVLYEDSIKVPFLLRVPWMGREQRAVRGRVSLVDLVPTLLDLLGLGSPPRIEGKSLRPVLEGASDLSANDVVVEWNGRGGRPITGEAEVHRLLVLPWRTIISADGWKLNLSPEDQCELYDLNADPFEQENLFDEPGHRGRERDLAKRIREWQACTNDTASVPVI